MKKENCIFSVIYDLDLNEKISRKSVASLRMELGRELAKKHKDKGIVVPIPESGIFQALGYGEELGMSFVRGITREYNASRTVFEKDKEKRIRLLKDKLKVIGDLVKDKKVILVDEAIISGTTLSIVVDKLRKAKVKEIHVRIPSPPMINPCNKGILDKKAYLIANEQDLDRYFKVDSLKFLDYQTFVKFIKENFNDEICYECFNAPFKEGKTKGK